MYADQYMRKKKQVSRGTKTAPPLLVDMDMMCLPSEKVSYYLWILQGPSALTNLVSFPLIPSKINY